MRDKKRIARIIAKLLKLWNTVPDWRFCQIISNLHGLGPQDIFHTEDDDLEKAIDELLKNNLTST